MLVFFWGVFVGLLIALGGSLLPLCLENLSYEVQQKMALSILVGLVILGVLLATGLWIGSSGGEIKFIPATPTPILGR